MSEWNIIHENFHTKHSVLTAPDEHMPYIIQLHIMSIRWVYYEQMKQQFIWLVSEKKTEAVNAYLIKNSKGEGEGGSGKKKKEERDRDTDRETERFRVSAIDLTGHLRPTLYTHTTPINLRRVLPTACESNLSPPLPYCSL